MELGELKKALLDFDYKRAEELIKEALSKGVDSRGIARIFLEVIEEAEKNSYGDAVFKHNIKTWLVPHAIRIYELARRLHNKYLKPVLRPWLGKKVVLGNMAPDIHAYGSLYGTMALELAGFDVKYLGVNVKPETFLEESKACDVVAYTSLMAEAYPNQERFVKMLEEAGLREKVKVAVGGTMPYEIVSRIGADAYLNSLTLAVKSLKHITGVERYSRDEVPTVIRED